MNSVVIRGPAAQFAQIAEVEGLNVDHGMATDIGDDHLLAAYATDEAVEAIRALGFTVDVKETAQEQNDRLAQAIADGGDDVTSVDIA